MTYEETLRHFKSLQRRYTTEHNGKMCEKVALAINAIEKQIPKKLIKEEYMYGFTVKCANGHNIPNVCGYGEMPYCPFCGQKLKWRDEE